MALVEIDVLSAMALGLTLQELESIYLIQFPVLQKYEESTWYDKDGRVAYSTKRGLGNMQVSQKEWNAIADKSSYTLCDRIEDYRRAWRHFSYLLASSE